MLDRQRDERQTDRQSDVQTDEQTENGRTEIWTDGEMDRRTGGQTDIPTGSCRKTDR